MALNQDMEPISKIRTLSYKDCMNLFTNNKTLKYCTYYYFWYIKLVSITKCLDVDEDIP